MSIFNDTFGTWKLQFCVLEKSLNFVPLVCYKPCKSNRLSSIAVIFISLTAVLLQQLAPLLHAICGYPGITVVHITM